MIFAVNQTMILNPTCLAINFLNTLRSRLVGAGHRIDSKVAGRYQLRVCNCNMESSGYVPWSYNSNGDGLKQFY